MILICGLDKLANLILFLILLVGKIFAILHISPIYLFLAKEEQRHVVVGFKIFEI